MQEFMSLTRNKNEITLPWNLQLRRRGTPNFSINGNESLMWRGMVLGDDRKWMLTHQRRG